jgi:predicted GIY-YIG superfamily endonuclease
VLQHKTGQMQGFTKRYKVHRLVYFETYKYITNAIEREKEIKAWRREKRVALIESLNPPWEDLAASVQLKRTADGLFGLVHDSRSIRSFGGRDDDNSS